MLAGALIAPAVVAADPSHGQNSSTRHVLLLSIDGLHQSDMDWYVANFPHSALAALVHRGVDFTHASTPVPSDSFPGMVAQATGGNPETTGVYYDSTFNHKLLPAGTTRCPAGAPTGADVEYAENLDHDPTSIDAGQGLRGLPGSILSMTEHPETLIDPAKLPVDPTTCKPVYPHQYLKVNTIFEVARAHNLRTAWSDKHPAYEILDSPSGTGVQDLFTPEINSSSNGMPTGPDWTNNNANTQQYDGYKAQAILNEIAGLDHSGTKPVGVPAIFGMNFQSVSTAQKLRISDGQPGGYTTGGVTPGPVFTSALNFVDSEVKAFVDKIHAQGLDGSTTIILSAKHGQSPTDPTALIRIPDGPLLDGLNAAWKAAHPGAGDLVAHATDDDAMLLWLTDHSQAAAEFAKTFLLTQAGQGNGINDNPTFTASGLAKVFAGTAAAKYFGVPGGDPRVPDVFGIVQHGVVYTGGTSKIAEHGGADPQDRNVPIVVAGAGVDDAGHSVSEPVETTQIAPTILRLLGLDPAELKAVQREHTSTLVD